MFVYFSHVCSVITYKYITEHTGIYCYVRSSVIVNCRWIKSRYTIEKHMLSIASVMLMFDCISDESFSIVEPMWMKSPRFSHVFFLFRGQRKCFFLTIQKLTKRVVYPATLYRC